MTHQYCRGILPHFVFAILLTTIALLCSTSVAWAKNPVATINVIDYKANPADNNSDRDAFVKALREADRLAKAKKCGNGDYVKVVVPVVNGKGTYCFDDAVPIFSHTWLALDNGVTMKFLRNRKDGENRNAIISNEHAQNPSEVLSDSNPICPYSSSCSHGGYNQSSYIKITGGTWNGDAKINDNHVMRSIMTFRHMNNLVIEGLTIKNCDGVHVINIDGVNGLTINNVRIENHFKDTPDGNVVPEDSDHTHEAIHIDIVPKGLDKDGNNKNQSEAYPFDGTPNKHVTITNTTISNGQSGIGTHNGETGTINEHFVIKSCYFEKLKYRCISLINLYGSDEVGVNYVTENTAKDVTCFVNAVNCWGNLLIGNNTIDNTSYTASAAEQAVSHNIAAIELREGAEAAVKKNVVTNAIGHGIFVGNNDENTYGTQTSGNTAGGRCYVSVAENTVTNPNWNGIYIRDNCKAWVTSNTVTSNRKPIDNDKNRRVGIFLNKNGWSNEVKANTVTGTNGVKGFTCGIEASDSPGTKVWENKVSNCTDKGIALWNVTGDPKNVGYQQVTGSTVSNCDIGILVATDPKDPTQVKKAVYAKIAWNTVSSCTRGIVVDGVTSPRIWEKTYISDCTGYGVDIRNSPGAHVTGTEIKSCKQGGIQVLNSKDVTIKWDTIKNCGTGIVYDNSVATQGSGVTFASNGKNTSYVNHPTVNGKKR